MSIDEFGLKSARNNPDYNKIANEYLEIRDSMIIEVGLNNKEVMKNLKLLSKIYKSKIA